MHLPSVEQLTDRYLKLDPQHISDPKKVKIFQSICKGAFLFAMTIRQAFPRMDDTNQVNPAIPPLLEAIDEVVITANEVLADQPIRVRLLTDEAAEAIIKGSDGDIVQVTDGQSEETKSERGDEGSAAAPEPGSVPGPLLRAGGWAGPGGEGDAGGLPGGEQGVNDPNEGQRNDPPKSEDGGQPGEAAG